MMLLNCNGAPGNGAIGSIVSVTEWLAEKGVNFEQAYDSPKPAAAGKEGQMQAVKGQAIHESSSLTVWEYGRQLDSVNVAYARISGRHPVEGWSCTKELDQVFFVISGVGTVHYRATASAKEDTYDIGPEDQGCFHAGSLHYVVPHGDEPLCLSVVTSPPFWRVYPSDKEAGSGGVSRALEESHVCDQSIVRAPDGSLIRPLMSAKGASCIYVELKPGEVSQAVRGNRVEEIWYFLKGEGQMWRRFGDEEAVTEIKPELTLNIPRGGEFQFRATGSQPLCAFVATVPPWNVDDPYISEICRGKWEPTAVVGTIENTPIT